jgi:hypothetical protein
MKRLLALTLLFALAPAHAQKLSLTIGNAVAGQDPSFKTAQFVFRVNGCADLTKAQVTATAEGLVDGSRRTTTLRLFPLLTPGGYAVTPQWGTGGKWVVAITATCRNETAGAIVPVNARSFAREDLQLFSRAPSPEEIETALKKSDRPAAPPVQ